jgi:hypothetical protein
MYWLRSGQVVEIRSGDVDDRGGFAMWGVSCLCWGSGIWRACLVASVSLVVGHGKKFLLRGGQRRGREVWGMVWACGSERIHILMGIGQITENGQL